MREKVWYTTEISTEFEQNIRIQPTETFDGITIEFKDINDPTYDRHLYLNKESLEVFIAKMREMMEHVKK
jgi:hypothetical protein